MILLRNILLWLGSIIIFNIVAIFGFIFNIFKYAINKQLANFFYILAVGEDQRGGSYLYGTEDLTISSYTYYLGVIKKVKRVYYFMLFVDFFPRIFGYKNHCKISYEHETAKLK